MKKYKITVWYLDPDDHIMSVGLSDTNGKNRFQSKDIAITARNNAIETGIWLNDEYFMPPSTLRMFRIEEVDEQ